MTDQMSRREFLTTAPAAASVLAAGMSLAPRLVEPGYPEIGAQPYTPLSDYPIVAKRFSDVTVSDAFWKPKMTTNAEVTIPFEADRQGAPAGGLSGNVLEAAIYSLRTHPDPALQARVQARIDQLAASDAGPAASEQ